MQNARICILIRITYLYKSVGKIPIWPPPRLYRPPTDPHTDPAFSSTAKQPGTGHSFDPIERIIQAKQRAFVYDFFIDHRSVRKAACLYGTS